MILRRERDRDRETERLKDRDRAKKNKRMEQRQDGQNESVHRRVKGQLRSWFYRHSLSPAVFLNVCFSILAGPEVSSDKPSLLKEWTLQTGLVRPVKENKISKTGNGKCLCIVEHRLGLAQACCWLERDVVKWQGLWGA